MHGHNNVLGAVIFPHNIGLGCTRNPALVEKVERITAEEVRATGIQWAFAPCVTVPQDIRWGRTYEGFSEDPQVVQGTGRAGGARLPGRRPGQPACRAGLRQALRRRWRHGLRLRAPAARASTRAIRAWTKRRCAAFTCRATSAAIKAGVGSIMPSYSSWNGVKCSGNKRLLTEILKQELGFEGFLISDYNAIDQLDPRLQESHRHLDQRRHGHGDGADALSGVHRRPEGTGGGGQGADVAHRRRGDAAFCA